LDEVQLEDGDDEVVDLPLGEHFEADLGVAGDVSQNPQAL
jgi:hypothetical protein